VIHAPKGRALREVPLKEAPRIEPGSSNSRHRILIVDDEPVNRAHCHRMLEPVSHAYEEAVDGDEALQCIAQGRFDLVVLDIDTPKMDGTFVLRTIRAHPPYRI